LTLRVILKSSISTEILSGQDRIRDTSFHRHSEVVIRGCLLWLRIRTYLAATLGVPKYLNPVLLSSCLLPALVRNETRRFSPTKHRLSTSSLDTIVRNNIASLSNRGLLWYNDRQSHLSLLHLYQASDFLPGSRIGGSLELVKDSRTDRGIIKVREDVHACRCQSQGGGQESFGMSRMQWPRCRKARYALC
jgi:hypothetical protein